MSLPCGLCHNTGRITEYEDSWPCPCCRPQHDFVTVLGLAFKDWTGLRVVSYQLVSQLDKSAYATIEFTGSAMTRFLFADSVKEQAEEWRDKIKELVEAVSQLDRNPKGLDLRDVQLTIKGCQEAVNLN